MKTTLIFTIFLCFASLVLAIPIPRPGSDDGAPRRLDKGKARAIDPPSPPQSRPHTPTPEDDPRVPLPGRTGTDAGVRSDVVTMHYGDDHFPEHMGHVQRNQAAFPHNRDPLSVSNRDQINENRANALRHVPPAPRQPGTNERRVRDEKLPAMLNNPHHHTSTTVEYAPRHESNREGHHLSTFSDQIAAAGPNALGQIRANPGWLPLHPEQRRGHEAPARLGSHSFRPSPPSGSGDDASQKDKKPRGEKKQVATSDEHQEGTSKQTTETATPERHIPRSGEMILRERIGRKVQEPTRTPATGSKKRQVPAGGSNLRPGRALPAGHVWTPSLEGHRASHFGAPGHVQEADKRYPPRPQNHAHYMSQLTEARQRFSSERHRVPVVRKGMAKYRPKQTANLEKFEKQFGKARHGNAQGRAHEAPARLQTHAPPSRPLQRDAARVTSHSSQHQQHSQTHGAASTSGPEHQTRPSSPHQHPGPGSSKPNSKSRSGSKPEASPKPGSSKRK